MNRPLEVPGSGAYTRCLTLRRLQVAVPDSASKNGSSKTELRSNCGLKVYTSTTQLAWRQRPVGMVWPCPCSSTLQNWVAASKLPFGNGLWQVPAPKVCLGSVWKVCQGQNCARTTGTIRTAAVRCLGLCPGNVYQHGNSHTLHPSKPLQTPPNAYL